MYKYCSKCGNITGGNNFLEERCWVCGNSLIPVPTKYIQEHEILTDKELEDRAIVLIEELVKTSPEFDQYLFDHRDEIIEEKSRPIRAALGKGKGISNTPKCPTCGSTSVQKITGLERGVSVAALGLFSKKINKSFKCNHCGYTW